MRVLRPAVLAAAACVLLAAAALAQTGGLSVTGLPPLSARPQEFVTLVYSVRHDGAQTVEVAFSLSAPPGFVPLEAPGTRTLAPGAEALVFVTLLVPQNAAAGDHPVTLTARRVDDPTRQASATTVVRVLAAAALRVRAAGLARFEAGEAVVPFEVVNDGNVRDRVDLTAASSDGFALRVAPEQVEVDPGVRAAVEVRLAVPAPAAARLRQTVVTLTAVSTGPGQARASASATVTLEPPGPDEVSTQLAWVMPSQLSLSFAQQRDPAAFSGLAQFRGGGAFAEG